MRVIDAAERLLYAMAMVATVSCGTPAGAQDVAGVIQLAERDRGARDPVSALRRYEAALATVPTNYDLLWRAALEAVDLGEAATDATVRNRYNALAEAYARRAVSANAAGADGHFVLAVALGRTAQSVGARERVKYAAEIRSVALDAVRLDPRHAGALHVLGVWNAEVMRLGGLTRFAARNFLGGRIFEQASWGEARRYMEAAVAADPGRITHRLDLALIHNDMKQPALARTTCEAVQRMPTVEFNDGRYKRDCEALVRRLR